MVMVGCRAAAQGTSKNLSGGTAGRLAGCIGMKWVLMGAWGRGASSDPTRAGWDASETINLEDAHPSFAMMNSTGGWMDGWFGSGSSGAMWGWAAAGILLVVLLLVVINNQTKK